MITDDLITVLVADLAISSVRLQRTFALALAMGAVLAAAAFFLWIGFRPDIAQALETVRFLFKFVVTLSLAATATGFLVRLARPGVSPGLWRYAWLVAPLLLAFAVVTELAVMPAATWWPRLVGSNARACLTLIPLLSIGPLACTLLALRRGAPTRPGLAGAVAGLSRAVSRRRSMRRIVPTTARSSWPPGIRSRSASSFWRAMVPAHAA